MLQHRHGAGGKSCFGIPHGGGAVSVDGAEIAVSVNERDGEGILLGHMNQGVVNGAVAVRVIFTHGIADDTGAFSVGLLRIQSKLVHGVKNPALYRL